MNISKERITIVNSLNISGWYIYVAINRAPM